MSLGGKAPTRYWYFIQWYNKTSLGSKSEDWKVKVKTENTHKTESDRIRQNQTESDRIRQNQTESDRIQKLKPLPGVHTRQDNALKHSSQKVRMINTETSGVAGSARIKKNGNAFFYVFTYM